MIRERIIFCGLGLFWGCAVRRTVWSQLGSGLTVVEQGLGGCAGDAGVSIGIFVGHNSMCSIFSEPQIHF